MPDQKTTERRIALFLDFENLVTNTGITPSSFDLQPSLDRLLEKGKVIFRRAYCDWSRFRDAKKHLHEFGVELLDVPPTTTSGKNGADMRLVIDALELCHARDYIDTFVIGSGDSDFCPLAYKLRENNRLVIGIGVKESTSKMFVKACDEFIYLKSKSAVAAATESPDQPPAKQGRGRRRRGAGASSTAEPKAPAAAQPRAEKKPRVVPDVAREVVTSLVSQAAEPINPSAIKEAIVRRQPDFDERDHGFSTFSRLLEAMEKEGLLRRIQYKGRQLHVVGPSHEAGEDVDEPPAVEPTGEAGGPHDPGADDSDDPGDEEIPF